MLKYLYKYYTGTESLYQKGLTDGAIKNCCQHAQRETTSTAGIQTVMSVWIHTWCQRRIYSFPTDSATTGESELRVRPALFKKTFSNNTFDGNFSTLKTSSVDGPALT